MAFRTFPVVLPTYAGRGRCEQESCTEAGGSHELSREANVWPHNDVHDRQAQQTQETDRTGG